MGEKYHSPKLEQQEANNLKGSLCLSLPHGVSSELGVWGHAECKLDWRDWQGRAHVTGEVAGRLVPACFGHSLSCPLSSEAAIGAPVVQPQGSNWVVLAEVPFTAPGLSFWGAKWC